MTVSIGEGWEHAVSIKENLGKAFIIFDGAMGTMLQKAGLKTGEIPETYNIDKPELIRDIHKKYIEAGADVVTTNTFQANELKLKGCPYSVEEIIEAGVKVAKESGAKYVALDVGPLGQLMEPMGTITFEQAYEIFARQVKAGEKAGADLVLIETLSDIYEAKAAILAVKENTSLPVFCTMSFQQDKRTFIGTDALTATTVLQSLGVDALGVNCSLGPKELMPVVEEILRYARVPVMIQPNAGMPRIEGNETVYDITPVQFAQYVKAMAEKGGAVFGGCCGTTPEYIGEVKRILTGALPVMTEPERLTCVCSSTKTHILDGKITLIGERINPTGKKKLKEALKSGDMAYILTEAVNQQEYGAHVIDVNVGLPEINEVEMMKKVVKEVQGIISLPLQIDSSNTAAIEAGVRVYNGKPIINSVNGKEESLNQVLPIVKKYGTCVVGLTLDDKGIPSTAEERFAVARKIVERAEACGIPREDIIIDCLVLTASAQQAEVMESIKTVTMVKEHLKVKTVLGVSNVSFGLPYRELVNCTYLAAALARGLDAAIINPMSEGIMDTIYAYRVLSGEDQEAEAFISRYANRVKTPPATGNNGASQGNTGHNPGNQGNTAPGPGKTLKELIIEGRKDEAAAKTKAHLQDMSPVEVIETYFVPALDTVGEKYEKGAFFLPQLIQSAEAVKKSFEIIKEVMSSSNQETVSKGKIVLATVKGDIHDIGKNIVKMLLENYGYDVIDLGKDVDAETILQSAQDHRAQLIGLSALMTTTVKNMEDIIKSIRNASYECGIMVGGAVLTQEYADMVGADYYARDARDGVKIANEFFKS